VDDRRTGRRSPPTVRRAGRPGSARTAPRPTAAPGPTSPEAAGRDALAQRGRGGFQADEEMRVGAERPEHCVEVKRGPDDLGGPPPRRVGWSIGAQDLPADASRRRCAPCGVGRRLRRFGVARHPARAHPHDVSLGGGDRRTRASRCGDVHRDLDRAHARRQGRGPRDEAHPDRGNVRRHPARVAGRDPVVRPGPSRQRLDLRDGRPRDLLAGSRASPVGHRGPGPLLPSRRRDPGRPSGGAQRSISRSTPSGLHGEPCCSLSASASRSPTGPVWPR
jgi:hypothetical protein